MSAVSAVRWSAVDLVLPLLLLLLAVALVVGAGGAISPEAWIEGLLLAGVLLLLCGLFAAYAAAHGW
jgi:hypothetical protein